MSCKKSFLDRQTSATSTTHKLKLKHITAKLTMEEEDYTQLDLIDNVEYSSSAKVSWIAEIKPESQPPIEFEQMYGESPTKNRPRKSEIMKTKVMIIQTEVCLVVTVPGG